MNEEHTQSMDWGQERQEQEGKKGELKNHSTRLMHEIESMRTASIEGVQIVRT
jgi:hypothetical protein